eukprot:319851-Amphidinium_carterae.1
MDKASASAAGDSGFKSQAAQKAMCSLLTGVDTFHFSASLFFAQVGARQGILEFIADWFCQ